ncbi:MAG: NAD(P)/FAD-dependent oxidoreductase [archaeon]|nr:NAD(P)/FAD-dependent oxidoreductase [archaeon]
MAQIYSDLDKTYDLIIVGAGTGGCSTAITAAREGLDVCIIDSKGNEGIGRKVCGDLMGKSIISFINDHLGLDYSDIITNELNSMDIYSPDGTVIPMPADGVMIDRYKFGQAFLNDALKAGCDLKDSCRCNGPVIEEGYVCGVELYDSIQKKESVIRSRIIVDASGASGGFRKKVCGSDSLDTSYLKRDIEPRDMSCSYRQIIELKNPLDDVHKGMITLLPEFGGYYWVFPEDEKTANVGIGIACNHKKKILKKRLEYIMAEDEIFNGSKIIEGGGGSVPTRRSFYSLVANGIILVGDAGSEVNPLTGGGIGPSIGAGYMCAKTAAEAIKNNDVSQNSLWKYNTWYHDPNNKLRLEYKADLFNGGIHAGRDVIREFVQSISDADVNWSFKNCVNNSTFSKIVSADSSLLTPKMKAESLIKGIRNPILLRIGETMSLMKEMNEIYENYPATPDMFPGWKKEVESVDAKFNNISTQSSWGLWLNILSKIFC